MASPTKSTTRRSPRPLAPAADDAPAAVVEAPESRATAAAPAKPRKAAATKSAAKKTATGMSAATKPAAAKPAVDQAPAKTAAKTAAKKAAAKGTAKSAAVASQPAAKTAASKKAAAKNAVAKKEVAKKARRGPAAADRAAEAAVADAPRAAAVRPHAADAPVDAPATDVWPVEQVGEAKSRAETKAEVKAEPKVESKVESSHAAPSATPREAVTEVPAAAASGAGHSAVTLIDGDLRRIAWHAGSDCPPALAEAARARLDDEGCFAADDDAALPLLQRLASDAGHRLRIDEAVWDRIAADRDARCRLQILESVYPGGPASTALQTLLAAPLPLYQAEGALWAVVAGRALLADERGMGKSVQAIAAARLWQRHFGVQRVLVLCAPAQRAAWQRAWLRFAGVTAQVMEGGLHQRQSQWSSDAELRILSPEALASDAAHLAQWAPELVIVDEPQRLALDAAGWAALDAAGAAHALVLCGAPLDRHPALLETLVDWLDPQRQGPLAALRALQSARDSGEVLAEDTVEHIGAQLSRLLLQRQREDLIDQLPPLVYSERLLPLTAPQRDAHDRHLAACRRMLDRWQRSGYLSDSDQRRLGQSLQAMRSACSRSDPADAASPLPEPVRQALLSQLDDWADTSGGRVAVLCGSVQERDQVRELLQEQLQHQLRDGSGNEPGDRAAPVVLGPDDPVHEAPDAVLQIGVPWRPRTTPLGDAAPGQQWLLLVAQRSIDAGLYDTLALRRDTAPGLADDDGGACLHGAALAGWLQALQRALQAIDDGQPRP